ncbi:MAG: hypothetical protein ACK5PS_16905 [Desulfopila sp.]
MSFSIKRQNLYETRQDGKICYWAEEFRSSLWLRLSDPAMLISCSECSVSAYGASRQLAFPMFTVENWTKAFRAGKLGNRREQQRLITEIELELDRVKQESNILKNTPRISEYCKLACLPRNRCAARND